MWLLFIQGVYSKQFSMSSGIQNIFSPGLHSAPCFKENWQPESQALSLWMTSQSWTVPGLEVAHSKTEDSYQSSLGCISQSEGLCGLQHSPQCTQGSGLDPCPWQVLNSIFYTAKCAHEVWLDALPLRGPPHPLPCRRRRTKVLHPCRFRLPLAYHWYEAAVFLGEHWQLSAPLYAEELLS